MATQYDYGTIDPASKSGTALATDLNESRNAWVSNHRGGTRPAYLIPATTDYHGALWIDDTTASAWELNLWDGTDDVTLFTINSATHKASLAADVIAVSGDIDTAGHIQLTTNEEDVIFNDAVGQAILDMNGAGLFTVNAVVGSRWEVNGTGKMQLTTGQLSPTSLNGIGLGSETLTFGTAWMQKLYIDPDDTWDYTTYPPNASGDDLVIASASGTVGMSFLNAGNAYILFGDLANRAQAQIRHLHSTNTMDLLAGAVLGFYTAGVMAVQIDSSQNTLVQGDLSMSGGGDVLFSASTASAVFNDVSRRVKFHDSVNNVGWHIRPRTDIDGRLEIIATDGSGSGATVAANFLPSSLNMTLGGNLILAATNPTLQLGNSLGAATMQGRADLTNNVTHDAMFGGVLRFRQVWQANTGIPTERYLMDCHDAAGTQNYRMFIHNYQGTTTFATNSASNRAFTITNDGAGRADLYVKGYFYFSIDDMRIHLPTSTGGGGNCIVKTDSTGRLFLDGKVGGILQTNGVSHFGWDAAGFYPWFVAGMDLGVSATAEWDNLYMSGRINAAEGTDEVHYLGRARIGYNGTDSDWAVFSHEDHMTGTNYGLAQTSTGVVVINFPAGQSVVFRRNDSDIGYITNASVFDWNGGMQVAGTFEAESDSHFADGARYTSKATLTSGTSITWNTRSDPVAKLTTGHNVTTFTLAQAEQGSNCTLEIVQGGSHTIAWGSEVKFAGGTHPDISSGTTVISFFCYDGTNWVAAALENIS